MPPHRVSVTRNSQLVADVATKIANASKEGGILGFGGVAVSPAEQTMLDQLRSVIGER